MNQLLSKSSIKSKRKKKQQPKDRLEKFKILKYLIGTLTISAILVGSAWLVVNKSTLSTVGTTKILEFKTQDSVTSEAIVDKPVQSTEEDLELQNINDEKLRLVTQREIQGILETTVIKPFNLRNGDNCIVTIKAGLVSQYNCSNSVFRRSVETALTQNESVLKKLLQDNKLNAKIRLELQ
ncbi:hypothetical protein [Photobacterium kishitanii]|uniref:Uncharacterized protein n=1 Tax=Photobacterium kishitanii TaxID=318456 RepID=A0A2T3KMN7_9GAMM|nr:hypothetical protein [Photobacterium kishitanii]PSV01056.1 hypothetical protein C9J27_03295 [Photobacterium kishitanii]